MASLGTLRGSIVALNLTMGRAPADFPLPVVSASGKRQYANSLWDAVEVEWWLAAHPAMTTAP